MLYTANVTIYLPDEVEDRVRSAAKAEGISVSRWIASRISEVIQDAPAAEFLQLEGAFPDFPAAEELRQGYGKDIRRERLR